MVVEVDHSSEYGRDRHSCFHSFRFYARCVARTYPRMLWYGFRHGQHRSFVSPFFTSFLFGRQLGSHGYTPFSKCVTHYDTFSTSAAKMSWALPRGMRLLRKPMPPCSVCGVYPHPCKTAWPTYFPQSYLLQAAAHRQREFHKSSLPTIFKSADFSMGTGAAGG